VRARYAVNTSKALEAIVWLAKRRPRIDFYHIVKCAFYADKYHINKFGRPIAGDQYIADTYGPLGKTIYGILRGDPIEMLALGGNGSLPFEIVGRWQILASRDANIHLLSDSDIEALDYAVDEFADRSFDDLYRKSHDDPAYMAANGGPMRFEDLIDEHDPDRREKIENIRENAPSAVF
jgi:hypothetical protein